MRKSPLTLLPPPGSAFPSVVTLIVPVNADQSTSNVERIHGMRTLKVPPPVSVPKMSVRASALNVPVWPAGTMKWKVAPLKPLTFEYIVNVPPLKITRPVPSAPEFALSFASVTVAPALMVVPPVNEFTPVSINAPAPFLVNEAVPVIAATVGSGPPIV